jgi:hypothetical protein
VDDAADDVAPADLAGAWLFVVRQWGRELTAPERARLVVVAHVIGEDRFKVTPRVEKQMVEAFFTHGADEAFGKPPLLGRSVSRRRGERVEVTLE